jgi:hypothetical protein
MPLDEDDACPCPGGAAAGRTVVAQRVADARRPTALGQQPPDCPACPHRRMSMPSPSMTAIPVESAAILQTLQTAHDDGRSLSRANVTDDTAHGSTSRAAAATMRRRPGPRLLRQGQRRSNARHARPAARVIQLLAFPWSWTNVRGRPFTVVDHAPGALSARLPAPRFAWLARRGQSSGCGRPWEASADLSIFAARGLWVAPPA